MSLPTRDNYRSYDSPIILEGKRPDPFGQTHIYTSPEETPFVDAEKSARVEVLKRRDTNYKKRIHWFRTGTRICSALLSAYLLGSLSYSLAIYNSTKNRLIPSPIQHHPWREPIVLWPTFMLLAIAGLTLLLNLTVLAASCCCSVRTEKTADRTTDYAVYVMTAAHLAAWAVATGLFRNANKGEVSSDLWGYSCSGVADALAADVQSFMDFGMLCTVQTGAWYSTIIECVMYFFTVLAIILALVRKRRQKELTRVVSEHLSNVRIDDKF